MRSCHLVLLSLCGSLLWAEDGANNPLFHLGFSRRMFAEINENDAKASIRAWAQTVAHEHRVRMDPVAQLYNGTKAICAALKSGEVDAISVPFDEYVEISRQVETCNWFMTLIGGNIYEEYVLLVHADGPIQNLAALQGQRLVIRDAVRMCLADTWLDTLLLTNGWRGMEGFFGEVARLPKLSPVVLRVFFHQADACVVDMGGFKTLCELNPQLRSSISVLARSPPLVPALLCFRKNFESSEKSKIIAALEKLHETVAGQQVLTIFRSEKLVPVSQAQLADTEIFLREAGRLRSAVDARRNIESASTSTPPRGGQP